MDLLGEAIDLDVSHRRRSTRNRELKPKQNTSQQESKIFSPAMNDVLVLADGDKIEFISETAIEPRDRAHSFSFDSHSHGGGD